MVPGHRLRQRPGQCARLLQEHDAPCPERGRLRRRHNRSDDPFQHAEILNEDYIRTARAKGLTDRVILQRHSLKAASLPVATIIGLLLAGLLTGVVVTEKVFTIPGLGRLAADAVVNRDIPVLQAVVVVMGGIIVFTNLLTDVIYAYLDPRVRF